MNSPGKRSLGDCVGVITETFVFSDILMFRVSSTVDIHLKEYFTLTLS